MIVLQTYPHLLTEMDSPPHRKNQSQTGRTAHWYLIGQPSSWEQVVESWTRSPIDRTGLKFLTLEVGDCEREGAFQPLVDWCSLNGVTLRFAVNMFASKGSGDTLLAEEISLAKNRELMVRLQFPGTTSIPYAIVHLSSWTIDRAFPLWFWLVDQQLLYQFTLASVIDTNQQERYAIAELFENLAHHESLNTEWQHHYSELRRVVTGEASAPQADYMILGSVADEAECNQALRAGRVPLPAIAMPPGERWRAIARRFKLDKWSLLFKGMFALARVQLLRTPRSLAYTRPNAKEKVLIVGWYGTETTGDKAILGGILEHLYAQHPDLDVTVGSMLPFYTRKTLAELGYGELTDVVPYDFKLLKELILSVNLVIMGGGPLMDLVEMYVMLRVLELARRHGAKTTIAGCGIGPALWPITRWAINGMLKQSSRTVLRDRNSLEQLQAWGSNVARVEVGLDPAISYVAHLPDRAHAGHQEKPVLGLGIRAWQRKFSRPMQLDEFKTRRDELISIYASVCDDFIDKYNGEAHLIPMHTLHIGDDDRWIQGWIKQMARRSESVKVHTESYSAAEVAALIQRCDIFVSMRYHSLLFATILGIPVIAIDYTLGGKVASFAQEQDVTDWVLDIRTLSGQELCEAIDDVWSRKHDIIEKLRAKHNDLVERSDLAGVRTAEILQVTRERFL